MSEQEQVDKYFNVALEDTDNELYQMKGRILRKEKILESYYFNPLEPGAFYGPEKLHRVLKLDRQPDLRLSTVRRFLNKQDAYSLHKPPKQRFKRLRVRVNSINEMFDVDLTDMTRYSKENNGVRYLLVAIDILSRFAFALPLTNKRPETVLKAFKEIIQERNPMKVRVDGGSEFKGVFKDFLEKHNITLTVAHNENIKSNYVERFNRTLKSLITRYLTHNNTKYYLDALPKLMDNYNNTLHSSLPNLSPVQVKKKNELKVWEHLYVKPLLLKKQSSKHNRSKAFVFKVGDLVRIPYLRRPFSKELDLKWTQDLFKVARRYKRQEIAQYKIKDFHDKLIEGTFYGNELQKVEKKENVLWQVEKILKRKRVKGKTYLLVRWLGWPSSFDSYVEESELKDI
ncbi:uncharacterized protein LOC124127214 [Haliotis rufescens]|uniref:uncharacterized protein LOC124127214 n=1 Tax=Haliotis rufescens TaxID=6454 RepID=UPI00201EF0A9|nr:uncharacterized protein LOC124127214 [Haliotis rufescens]